LTEERRKVKQARDRIRRANMTEEEKEALLKRKREQYKRKRGRIIQERLLNGDAIDKRGRKPINRKMSQSTPLDEIASSSNGLASFVS
jgi:L,D-peptidoglycan transpeptidase YkuD (ErfK/YbiS/YcfS/YnhG family)